MSAARPNGWPRPSSRPPAATPKALLPLLDSFVDTSEAELRSIADADAGAAAAPTTMTTARPKRSPRCFRTRAIVAVPGNHMSAVTKPELGRAIADFLAR